MIVLVAHGTRDPAGAEVVERLAARVRRAGPTVEVAYADVREPDVTTVLAGTRDSAVVVPAFLASGYHVRTDIPAQVAASGHGDVALARPLGADPALVGVAERRLAEAGFRPGDTVVLAAAGSADPSALAEVHLTARRLGTRLGTRVTVGYAATAAPAVGDAVATARRAGSRVAVASWLLAPGLFQRRLSGSGADVVAAPLGDHPAVARLVLHRAREARALRSTSGAAR